MSKQSSDDMTSGHVCKPEIRDVADFHLRWQEFRTLAAGAAGKSALDPDERWVLRWLIALADRVGEADVRPRTAADTPLNDVDGGSGHA